MGLRETVLLLLSFLAGACPAQGVKGHPAESHNLELVGYNDLQGRPAYMPVINRQGDRWIAYVGMHSGSEINGLTGRIEGNGTLLLDVTDPRRPRTLAHVPGDRLEPGKESEAQMVRVCNIAGGTYMLRDAAIRTRFEIWDVGDPAAPRFVAVLVDGLRTTHKHWWDCGDGMAYLPVQDTWRRRNTRIYDLADPGHPRFVRDFGLAGQEPGSAVEEPPAPIHGPVAYRDRVYFAYGSSNHGTVQIVDKARLLSGDPEPTPENLAVPQIGRIDMPRYWGGHTAYPVLGVAIEEFAKDTAGGVKDILVVASETVRDDCDGPRHPLFFLDISEPDRPFPISSFLVPERTGNFCQRGGRFGPHAVQESFAPVYYKKLIFVSYFNGGVRAVDVRDPFAPVEAGYYIPATTEKTKPYCKGSGAGRQCKAVIQTNNVETDERGYIYIVDRAGTGLHILSLSDDAKSHLSIHTD